MLEVQRARMRAATRKELARPSGGTLDTAPVLHEFLKSAKGPDSRRQTRKELASSSGGALDTVPVSREFLRMERRHR
jgi:hypothetical protein